MATPQPINLNLNLLLPTPTSQQHTFFHILNSALNAFPGGRDQDHGQNQTGEVKLSEAAENAAQQIDTFLGTTLEGNGNGNDADTIESFLWSLWEMLFLVAGQVPASHPGQDMLLEIVRALQRRGSMTVEIWGKNTQIWADLPLLGPSLREAWNRQPDFNNSPSATSSAAWVSINAFAARLLSADFLEHRPPFFAIWALRDALEKQPNKKETVECHILAASKWIFHSGRNLYQCVVNVEQKEDSSVLDEQQARATRGGGLYSGESGMNRPRWDFWRNRFLDFPREWVDDDNEVWEMCARAGEMMNTIEDEYRVGLGR